MQELNYQSKVTVKNKSELEKVIIKDAILWLLTYGHLEVFKENTDSHIVQEYSLNIHFEGDLENLIFVNMETLSKSDAKKISEIANKHGILGVVAWFAFKDGTNDMIHEMYKTDDYNKARELMGLGAETQMEEDYDTLDSESLEIIILGYCDCLLDLVKLEDDYQGWVHLSDDLEKEEE